MTPAGVLRSGVHRLLPLLAVLAAVAGVATWVVVTPLTQSPDEPAHVYYAWGTFTGQVGPDAEVADHRTRLVVPETLRRMPLRDCFAYDDPTATCPPLVEDTMRPREALSYMTRYPPPYYAVTGASLYVLVTSGVAGDSAIMATRLVSGALCLLVMGWGAILLRARFGGLTAVALTSVALTPMSWSMFAAINPNGIEIAAAFLLAAAVLAVRHHHGPGALPRSVSVAVPVAAAVLAWSRPLSFVWAGIVLVLLLVPEVAPDGTRWRAWRRPPLLRLGTVSISVTAVAVLGAVAWFGWAVQTRAEGAADEQLGAWPDLTWLDRCLLVLYKFGDIAVQAVGMFGWGDVLAPQVVALLWMAVSGALLALALGASSPWVVPRWAALAVLLLGAAVVAAHSLLTGFGWQGRYVLAISAPALVLTAPYVAAAAGSPAARRLLRGTVALLVLPAQLITCLTALWRFMYGQDIYTPRFPVASLPVGPVHWEPVIGHGPTLVTGLVGVAAAALVAVFSSSVRPGSSRRARRPTDVDGAG